MKKIDGFSLANSLKLTERAVDLEIGKTYNLYPAGVVTLERVTVRPSFRIETKFFFFSRVIPSYSVDLTLTQQPTQQGILGTRVFWHGAGRIY